MSFRVRVPDEIAELSNETLFSEIRALSAHEEAETLTSNQEQYLGNLRDEFYKRASVGGPYADYTGPDSDSDSEMEEP